MKIDFAINKLAKENGLPISAVGFESIDSTNAECKRLGEGGRGEGATVIARCQTAGIGTRGRSFFSPDGGLYFSILLKPEINPFECGRITTAAAVAVAETLREWGADARIKWVNDIYVDGKKVCGILTEARLDGEKMNYAVLGIGINLTLPSGGFPDEIKNTAGAVFGERALTDSEKALLCYGILQCFWTYYNDLFNGNIMQRYRELCVIVGKTVAVSRGSESYTATVKGIGEDFSLEVVTDGGQTETLQSGEVSLKF